MISVRSSKLATYGVALYIFSTVFSRYNLIASFSLSDIIFVALLIFTCVHVLIRNKIEKKIIILGWASVILIVLMSASINAQPTVYNVNTTKILSKCLFSVIILAYWIDSKSKVRVISYSILISGVVSLIGAFLQSYAMPQSDIFIDRFRKSHQNRLKMLGLNLPFVRSTGFAGAFGSYGLFVLGSYYVLLSKYIFSRKRRIKSGIYLIFSILILLAGLLFSQSRSTFLAALVSTVIHILLNLAKNINGKKLLLIIGLLFIVLLSSYYIYEVLYSIGGIGFERRIYQYKIAIKNLQLAPWLGIGFVDVENILGTSRVIHSSWLSVLTQGGVFSFLIYLSVLLYTLVHISSGLFRGNRHIISALLVSAFVALMIQISTYNGTFVVTNYIYVGVLFSVSRVFEKDG